MGASSIEQTPTWRVGLLFLAFGVVSLALERLFDWLEVRDRPAARARNRLLYC
jgi:hypothetical protein